MELHRQRIWIHPNEAVDALELRDKGEVKLYSYTYKVAWKRKKLCPVVRWDNLDRSPHVDRYDRSGAHLEQKTTQTRTLEEVTRLVGLFRKNIGTMDLSNL